MIAHECACLHQKGRKMAESTSVKMRQYILDTNVLINDPHAPFNFDEHDIIICMTVLEELDHIKDSSNPRHSLINRDARLAIQNIKKIINGATSKDVSNGVLIGEGKGKLRVVNDFDAINVTSLPSSVPDNRIIAAALKLQQTQSNNVTTILVTKDINLQLKSMAAGLENVQDYRNDQQISDMDYLTTGYLEVDTDFPMLIGSLEVKRVKDRNYTIIPKDDFINKYNDCFYNELYTNQFLFNGEDVWRVVDINDEHLKLECKKVSAMMNREAFGIKPRNLRQALALESLLDPDITAVQLTGGAGSGKTLLALAAALSQTIDTRLYSKIIVTRTTPPVSEEIGFLPGTESEKMAPWLAAFSDSLEVLLRPDTKGHTADKLNDDEAFEQTVSLVTSQANLQYKSMAFVRGRSFNNSFVILDESQNTTAHQMKTMLTRVGVGSKIVLLGNLSQVDARAVTALSSGLTHAVEKLKPFSVSSCIMLQGGERSELASIAEEEM